MKWTYRCEYVRCGNARCKSCPHGPYWYRYRHQGNRTYKQYIGKQRMEDRTPDRAAELHPWYGILSRRTASRQLAADILSWDSSRETINQAYRRASLRYHPDRGGSDFEMCCVNAAYSYLIGSI